MEIKSIIKNKTCYIISNELKNAILYYINDNNLLLDIHFFNLDQIIERIYFKYDDRAIYFVSKNYSVSYSNAKVIIESLKYLMYSKETNDYKYIYLSKIKNSLDDNSLLQYDNNFLDYLNQYEIITDLSFENPFFYKINELLSFKIFQLKNEENNNPVYEFNNSEEEIEYLANNIATLLNNNIPADKIHILNYNSSYFTYLDKIFSLYNIPFYLKSENVLYDIPYIRELYLHYIENNSVEFNSNFTDLNNQFITIINSINFIENKEDIAQYLLYKLKNQKIANTNYINCINFTNIETAFIDDNFYYFIGLNNKSYPLYRKDEDYISDNLKIQLGYLPSYKCNQICKEYALNKLLYDKNIIISYRNSDYFNKYLKSDLVDKISSTIERTNNINSYSKKYDELKITRELDHFYKYNQKSEKLVDLLKKVDINDYKNYDNSYKMIDTSYYLKTIANNKLSISYSSFEQYNQCHYKYYLNTILKEKDSSFNTYIGNLFHHVLEKIYEPEFIFEAAVNSYQSDYKLNDKETILLDNLLIDFKEKINIILEQYQRGNYKNIKKEERISLNIKSHISICINGIIDKIMLDDNNRGYIIDYKTGNTKLTLSYLQDGLKCQLPFYFYLLNKSSEYANIYLVGCYLQLINFKIKSYSDTSKEMLLEGLTIDDESLIEDIDKNYKENSFIKGIKPNKKGLGTYSKTFTNEDFERIVSIMEINIEKMITDICNGDFSISPKITKKKETTCVHCKYNDICYKTFKDYIDIRKDNQDEVDE